MIVSVIFGILLMARIFYMPQVVGVKFIYTVSEEDEREPHFHELEL
jgi:hypothetical protein